MSKSVLALAFEAGIHPFDIVVEARNPRLIADQAAKALAGRNAYFDPESRARFGTRVHQLLMSPNRLVFGAVESALPLGASERRYRTVCFRADGHVVYQTPEDRILDQYTASVDLQYRIGHADEERILVDLCNMRVRQGKRMIDSAERVLQQLSKQSPPAIS